MRLRQTIGLCLFFQLVALGLSPTDAAEPTLDDLWAGTAKFEVQTESFGADFGMHFLSVLYVQESISVFHIISDNGQPAIGLATTTDGVVFKNLGKILTHSDKGWDSRFASFPSVVKVGDKWYMVFEGAGDSPGDIGLATSDDGISFSKHPTPILIHAQRQPKDPKLSLGWERNNIGTPSIYYEDKQFYVFYHGYGVVAGGGPDDCQVGIATGADLLKLKRVGNGPILRTTKSNWDSGTIGKRSVMKQGNLYYMIFEGSTDQPYDKAKWSSGLARSKAYTGPWERFEKNPVLPITNGGFGYDGPEFVRIGETLYVYFRSPKSTTSRAALVWK